MIVWRGTIEESKAKYKEFDLFDENNSPGKYDKVRIRLMEGEKEIDLNYIPNIHSYI